MPSEDRIPEVLAVLHAASGPFRAAVVSAADELSAYLTAQRAPQEERAGREAARLGVFAEGHIDIDRFATLTGSAVPLDALRLGRLEQAQEVLAEFIASGDALYGLRVQRGADLRDALREAFAGRGRVFNAALAIDLLRAGSPLREPIGLTLEYREWTRPQRAIAPPIAVAVNGTDLQVGGLAEYMDGTQKIVLLVEGPAAPAPLARLIAPDTFVMQTNTIADLAKLGDFPGPAVAAVMPGECARFIHDPRAGNHVAQRLDVLHLPVPPVRAVAGGSLRQQLEELAWLKELAERVAPADAEPALAGASVTPADQLAAWLLSQTDLRED